MVFRVSTELVGGIRVMLVLHLGLVGLSIPGAWPTTGNEIVWGSFVVAMFCAIGWHSIRLLRSRGIGRIGWLAHAAWTCLLLSRAARDWEYFKPPVPPGDLDPIFGFGPLADLAGAINLAVQILAYSGMPVAAHFLIARDARMGSRDGAADPAAP